MLWLTIFSWATPWIGGAMVFVECIRFPFYLYDESKQVALLRWDPVAADDYRASAVRGALTVVGGPWTTGQQVHVQGIEGDCLVLRGEPGRQTKPAGNLNWWTAPSGMAPPSEARWVLAPGQPEARSELAARLAPRAEEVGGP
jgi:hypothetical protein